MRAFARAYFCTEQRLAVILILHAPYVDAGTASALLVVPARTVGVNGFTMLALTCSPGRRARHCRNRWLHVRQG